MVLFLPFTYLEQNLFIFHLLKDDRNIIADSTDSLIISVIGFIGRLFISVSLSNHIFSKLFQNLISLIEITGTMYHTFFDTSLNIYLIAYMYCLALSITVLLGVGYIGGFSFLKFPTVARAVGTFPCCDSEGLTNPS